MAEITNPSSGAVDLSAVTAAITAASAAEVAATQALQTATTRRVTRVTESVFTAGLWSNAPGAHIAINPDPNTLAMVLINTGTKNVYWDLFLDIGTKTPAPQYDNVMVPGGSIRIKEEEANMGVLLYTLGSATTSTVAINIEK